jgi:transposase-like protein
MSGEPQAVCPSCGERVPLNSGVGSAGTKVFTCQACGHQFDFAIDRERA